MRRRLFILIFCLILGILALAIFHERMHTGKTAPVSPATSARTSLFPSAPPPPGITTVYAHNLMLRKGPNLRIYVRWLRGEMVPILRGVYPSFDNPDSYVLDIQTGDIRVNVGDLNHYVNAGIAHSPLTHIHLSGKGNQVEIDGTLHKVFPIPVELAGTIAATSDNRIQLHVNKIDALKIPLKGLLGDFHVKLADIFHPHGLDGMDVQGNDIFFDTQKILPPPHIRGHLTNVRLVYPDIEEVFGNATHDIAHVEAWRNFLRLENGSLNFGKLTMHPVDLIMIDISNDAWFDLDLANYQAQLVNGYTRMTPQSGLQIFMPGLGTLPDTRANQNMSIEWLKNRNLAPPLDVVNQTKK